MKKPGLPTVLSVVGAIAAGALLFWTSQSVQQAEDRLADLQRSVLSEEQSIRVLRAEWDYLNRPDRLEGLASEYLGLSSSVAPLNISGDAGQLPNPSVPVLPEDKPFAEPRPVALQGDEKDFRALLNGLQMEGDDHE